MAKQPALTYQDFENACKELQQAGHQVTQRAIRQLLGGSFTKISEFMTKWKGEHTEPASKTYTSENLSKLIETELSVIVTGATGSLKKELEESSKQVKDAIEEVRKLEEESLNQQIALEQLKEDSEKRINRLEVELQVAKEQAELTIADLKNQLKDFVDTKISAARLQGRIDELEKPKT